jgi:predicted anti-sigma-YlaC factor YlaD
VGAQEELSDTEKWQRYVKTAEEAGLQVHLEACEACREAYKTIFGHEPEQGEND